MSAILSCVFTLESLINGRHQINVRRGIAVKTIMVSGASKRSHSIARDSKLFKEIVELMSKTSKMHMHVENLEVAKYIMGKVDGDENKLINERHQINVRRGILVKK